MFHRKLRTTVTVLALGVSTMGVLAGPASAEDNGPVGSGKGCPVEDENGNVTYVKPGTQVGLFRCGSDGEWHFGWLTTDNQVVQPPGPPPGNTHPEVLDLSDATMQATDQSVQQPPAGGDQAGASATDQAAGAVADQAASPSDAAQPPTPHAKPTRKHPKRHPHRRSHHVRH